MTTGQTASRGGTHSSPGDSPDADADAIIRSTCFRAALRRSGLQQKQLARLAGVSSRAIRNLELGTGTPRRESLLRVCHTMGVRPEDLRLPAPPPLLFLRLRRGLTVEELAVLADVSPTTIVRLETKDEKPRYNRVAAGIARALGTTEEALWGPKPWHRTRGKDRGPRAPRSRSRTPSRTPPAEPRRPRGGWSESLAAQVSAPQVWVLAAGLLIRTRAPLTEFPPPPTPDIASPHLLRAYAAQGVVDGIAACVAPDLAASQPAARPPSGSGPSVLLAYGPDAAAIPSARRRGEPAPVIVDARCWQSTVDRTLPRSDPAATSATATYRRAFRIGMQAAWLLEGARTQLDAARRDAGPNGPSPQAFAAADAVLRSALASPAAAFNPGKPARPARPAEPANERRVTQGRVLPRRTDSLTA